jgi:hypothetical protein
MRRLTLTTALAVVTALGAVSAAPAQGVSPAQLTKAGWTCFPVGALGVHCAPPGKDWLPTSPTLQLLYFEGEDPTSATARFLGVESLVRDDLFQRRGAKVCPTDPSGGWFAIDLPTGRYWGCHRN